MRFPLPRNCLLLWLCFLPIGLLNAALSPEAQTVMDRGVIAAKQQDYPLALRFFEDARKLAPEASEVYFNLGLTESKIPGRELRAIACFGAYFAANPAAPNAAAVKELIRQLAARNRVNVTRLLQTLLDAADAVPGVFRIEELLHVTQLALANGDIARARQAAALIQMGDSRDKLYRSLAEEYIAAAQIEAGGLADARKTVDSIPTANIRSRALLDLAEAQRKSGDSSGARKSLADAARAAEGINAESTEGIQAAWFVKSSEQARVVAAQARAGDITSAEKTFTHMESDPRSAYNRSIALVALATGHSQTGDKVKARKLLAAALDATSHIDPTYWGMEDAYRQIAIGHAQAGNFIEAMKLLNAVSDPWMKCEVLEGIAEAQAMTNNLAATATLATAQQLTAKIEDPKRRSLAQIQLVNVRLKLGDIAGAEAVLAIIPATIDRLTDAKDRLEIVGMLTELRAKTGLTAPPPSPVLPATEWLTQLDEQSEGADCPLNTGPFLNLAEHLRSLTANPDQSFNGLFATTKSLVSAQNVIHKMLKQQAGK